jgi:SNF2 family DNA or RNA helicase
MSFKPDPRLRKHQLEAFDFFKDKEQIGLFAEMGCGKTAVILNIAAYKYYNNQINGMLVIAPNTVHEQWHKEQIPMWLPLDTISCNVQCFGGTAKQKIFQPFPARTCQEFEIAITNIDTFSHKTKWIPIAEWVKQNKIFIVIDEVSSIKNIGADRTQRLLYSFNECIYKGKRLIRSESNSPCRAGLTGTPTTNSALDLWTIMEFLKPNYFAMDYYSFRMRYAILKRQDTAKSPVYVPINEKVWISVKRYCKTYGEAQYQYGIDEAAYNLIKSQTSYQGPCRNIDELKAKIKPVSIFQKLAECEDMPKQTYITKNVEMNVEQKKAYKSMKEQLIAKYGGTTMTAKNTLSALTRLSQISAGFMVQSNHTLTDDGELELVETSDELNDTRKTEWLGNTIPKLEMLYQDIETSSKPAIIITRFTAEAKRIYDDLLDKSYNVMLYTGWKKTSTIDEFKAGKYDIIVANGRCISRGFNLQNSCNMFFYSNSYSLEDRLQLEGRIFRIGQQNPCVYIDYSAKGTIDINIIKILQQKKSLLDYITTDLETIFNLEV